MKYTKMKKSLLTLTAMVMTLVLCMTTALPTFAAGANVSPTDNLSFTFNKYLVMDNEANVPNTTFGFTIVRGTAVLATADTPAIYAGIGTPTIESATFTPQDSTTSGTPTNTGETNKKYATKTVTVDFNNISFTAPGIYRYIITEKPSTDNANTNDPSNTRTLDVYVEYESGSDTNLEVAGYVLHTGDEAKPTEEQKSDGFTNTYTTNNLTLTKEVTGNQGDRDKYFTFTVNITGAVTGTVYTVDLTNAEASPTVDGTPKTNAATLTATGGEVNATYYLKDDQFIVIQGLTQDTNYQIIENSYTTDGYTTSYIIDSQSSVTDSDTNTQIMGTTDHKVTFTNNKNGIVPTGILLESAPYIILGVVVLAGFVALFATRRRRTRK